MSVSLFVLPASREQEGTESDEGQLPQVLEELKDLQVAPGTCLAKFQLKVKGEKLVRIGTVPQNRGHSWEGIPASSVGVVMCVPSLWSLKDLCSASSVITGRWPWDDHLLLFSSGYPAPKLYWFKDGQPLTTSDHIRMTDKKTLHTLEIVSVTREDSGQYAVYISNAVGAAYSSARLLVRGGCPEGLSRGELQALSASGCVFCSHCSSEQRDSDVQDSALQGTGDHGGLEPPPLPEHGK